MHLKLVFITYVDFTDHENKRSVDKMGAACRWVEVYGDLWFGGKKKWKKLGWKLCNFESFDLSIFVEIVKLNFKCQIPMSLSRVRSCRLHPTPSSVPLSSSRVIAE